MEERLLLGRQVDEYKQTLINQSQLIASLQAKVVNAQMQTASAKNLLLMQQQHDTTIDENNYPNNTNYHSINFTRDLVDERQYQPVISKGSASLAYFANNENLNPKREEQEYYHETTA